MAESRRLPPRHFTFRPLIFFSRATFSELESSPLWQMGSSGYSEASMVGMAASSLRKVINGRVFDRAELEETLDRVTSPTPLHTGPFRPTPDGQPELAVVFAGFSEHFVIATQTCDVSGHDKREFPYAMILPARTIMEICQTEQIDLQGRNQPITIENYLIERTGDVTIASVADATRYSEKLKEVLATWTPTENADKANQRLIANFLNKIRRTAAHLYDLPADDRFHVPELMVDFCTTYTVATRQLANFASGRVARIGDPYRYDFRARFCRPHLTNCHTPATRSNAI